MALRFFMSRQLLYHTPLKKGSGASKCSLYFHNIFAKNKTGYPNKPVDNFVNKFLHPCSFFKP